MTGQNGANKLNRVLNPSFVQRVYEVAVMYHGEYSDLCDLEIVALMKDCKALGAGCFLDSDLEGTAFYLAKLETLTREAEARSIIGDLNNV